MEIKNGLRRKETDMSFINLQSNCKCNYCIYSDFAKGCLKGLFLPLQLMITEKECPHYECDNEKKNNLKKMNLQREIKFRGKSIDGVWQYGNLLQFDNKECFVDGVKICPDTLGQFTGLKDKEGNDIYEGDIVKWDDMSNGKYWRFAVVRIDPDIIFDCSPVKSVCGMPNSTDYVFHYGRLQYQLTHKFLTVIGNIHESDTDIIIR